MLTRFFLIVPATCLIIAAVLCPNSALSATSSNSVDVAVVILSKSNCQFNNPASTALNFGTLDPLIPADVTVSTTLDFVCRGSEAVATFLISDDDGLHETGSNNNRMRHTSTITAFLPYTMTLTPVSGNADRNIDQTLNITGKLLGTDYQAAIAGTYADLVTLSIQP